jgi:hypothetical protein
LDDLADWLLTDQVIEVLRGAESTGVTATSMHSENLRAKDYALRRGAKHRRRNG